MRQICLKLILVLSLFTHLSLMSSLAYGQYQGQHHSIDLRDLVKYKSYLELPTDIILKALESRICHFTAPIYANTGKPDLSLCDQNLKLISNPNMKYTEVGAIGPTGHVSNETFIPNKNNLNTWTRTDTVFSVEFDGGDSVHKIDNGLYIVKVILFIHDSTRSKNEAEQYYFRRMTLKTDSSKGENQGRVMIISVDEEISLSDTFFEVYTDIIDRKTVLVDRIHSIKKVFPVGVGAFDIRTLTGMDSFVGSMTEELKTEAILTRHIPLDEKGEPVHVPMMEERNHPYWYKGRPFLGILDEYGTKYKEIGFHYQIDNDKLNRGFVSHGCIRVRDKDLYQLSVVVLKGTQKSIPVKVVNSFTQEPQLLNFVNFNHPHPKIDTSYKRIIYSDKNYLSNEAQKLVNKNIVPIKEATDFTETERYVWCSLNGKYDVIRYHGPWASVLGTDCLTRITTEKKSVQHVLDYLLKTSYQPPAITEHKVQTTSNYGSGSFKKHAEICPFDLATAATYYQNLTSDVLTYKIFKETCGCPRLNDVLMQGNFKGGWDEYYKYCPN